MPQASDGSPTAKAVFMAAIELESGEQRSRFVDEACGSNLQLRQEVNELLASFEQAGSFLDNKPGASFEATMDSGNMPDDGVDATMDSGNQLGGDQIGLLLLLRLVFSTFNYETKPT